MHDVACTFAAMRGWEVASYRWVSQGNRAATKSWPQLQFWAGGLEAAFQLSNAEGGGGDKYLGRGMKKESSASETPQKRGNQQMFAVERDGRGGCFSGCGHS